MNRKFSLQESLGTTIVAACLQEQQVKKNYGTSQHVSEIINSIKTLLDQKVDAEATNLY